MVLGGKAFCLSLKKLKKSDSKTLLEGIQYFIKKYELDIYEVCFVTDSCSVNICALNNLNSVPCIAHLPENLIKSGLKQSNIMKFSKILFDRDSVSILESNVSGEMQQLKEFSKLVAYFRPQRLNYQLADSGHLKLKQCNDTRWGSLHTMIETIYDC